MHGLRTIERMNRDNRTAEEIVRKHAGNETATKVYDALVDANIKEAQDRLQSRRAELTPNMQKALYPNAL